MGLARVLKVEKSSLWIWIVKSLRAPSLSNRFMKVAKLHVLRVASTRRMSSSLSASCSLLSAASTSAMNGEAAIPVATTSIQQPPLIKRTSSKRDREESNDDDSNSVKQTKLAPIFGGVKGKARAVDAVDAVLDPSAVLGQRASQGFACLYL